eukprot:4155353-Ditylum_brightwellii.AAC.1
MIQLIQNDDQVGLTIAIMLRWAQICAGTSTHILQDTRPIPHMEGHWTEHLQAGTAYIKATIRHKYE